MQKIMAKFCSDAVSLGLMYSQEKQKQCTWTISNMKQLR